jgi:DNA-binding transcriptional ArsR family regulator
MMRNIAIGLAAATIAVGGSTLSVSALYGQESGISKGSMSGSVKSDRYAELTPLQRERLRGMVRERFAELTPLQRERLRGMVRERFADLTPLQRERVLRFVRARYEQLTPLERERLYRHGPYGRR